MISIKGLKQGLLVVFSKESEPWLSKLREFEAKLNANEAFFKGGQVAFDVGPLSLSAADLHRALELLSSRDVTLFCVLSSDIRTLAAAEELGLQIALPAPKAREQKKRSAAEAVAAPVDAPAAQPADVAQTAQATDAPDAADAAQVIENPTPALVAEAEPPAKADTTATSTSTVTVAVDEEQEQGTDGALLKKRVRSGQMVRHPGHIVIIGDVNPGAQVIAGGDIIVWGKLQGTAHAGAYGNIDAVICALDLNPSLLKIADLTIRSHRGKAEMARVKDQEIIFSKWDNKT
jgi:septum site-determining protein MinC